MTRPRNKIGNRLGLAIRRASFHDKEDLQRLCEAAVGADDYVIPILDKVLLEHTIMIALDEAERVIGMMALVHSVDGGGWLGMARTHPDHRQKGVATSLIERFIGLAGRSGTPCLRLWTDHDNAAASGTARSLGFREISRFVRVNGPTLGGPLRAEKVGFDESLWTAMRGSNILAKGAGYFCYDWCFVPVSRSTLATICARGHTYAFGGNILCFDPFLDSLTEAFGFSMLAGRPSEMLPEARRQAGSYGCESASAFIPNDSSLIVMAKKAGYSLGHWGRVAVLYELTVPRSIWTQRIIPQELRHRPLLPSNLPRGRSPGQER